jgi:O-antigen/teichoic acid export membrane protein
MNTDLRQQAESAPISGSISVHQRATLSRQALHGAAWVTLLQGAVQGLGFLKGLVLARLLAPAEFGLFGMVWLFYSGLSSLSNVGLAGALIHSGRDDAAGLDAAWTLQLLRGLALALLFLALAPVAARFFGEPRLMALMPVMGLAFLLHGLTNIGIVTLQKEIAFRGLFVLHAVAAAVDCAVALAVAWWSRSAWAFVLAVVAGAAATAALSYRLHPYRPRLSRQWARMRSLMDFGRWMLAGQSAVFVATEGDDLLVGRLLGAAPLGLYRLSYLIATLPTTQLTAVIAQVAFPAYSKLRADPARLPAAFLRVLAAVSLLALPLAVGLFAFAPDYVPLLLGPEWLDTIPLIRILVIWGLLQAIGALAAPLLLALGRPRAVALLSALQAGLMLALAVPLYRRFALPGIAWAVTIAGLIQVPATLAIAKTHLGLRFGQLLRAAAPALLGASVMGGFVAWARALPAYDPSRPVPLLLVAAAGGVVYGGVLLLLRVRPRSVIDAHQ